MEAIAVAVVVVAIALASLVQLVIVRSGLAFVSREAKRSDGRSKVLFSVRFRLRGGFEIQLEVTPVIPDEEFRSN
jgi:hypothetical protein